MTRMKAAMLRSKALWRMPIILNHIQASWPGLSRPSTSFSLPPPYPPPHAGEGREGEDVDGRDKRGHDGGEVIPSRRNAPWQNGTSCLDCPALEREQSARALLDEQDDQHQDCNLAQHGAGHRFEELVGYAERHGADK